MKLYLIAGEASGDLHGSALMGALNHIRPDIVFRYWGGDQMAKIAGPPQKHIKDLAFMGFYEVIKHLPTILSNFKTCKEDILAFQPDALILIDYPGFNLRMAKWAKKQGIKVIYYISPQIWAWNQSRAEAIRENVDRMMVILPFEKAFYRSKNIDVDYVGHPLAHRLGTLQKDERFRLKHQLDDKPIIALLPGSRRQEVTKMLGIMLGATTNTDYQYIIAQAPNLEDSFYHSLLIKHAHVRLVKDETYQLLLNAQSAAVTSGTATLEAAILGVPQVVCYRSSPISYQLAKRLIKVKYISLVNLIADENLVPELIQSDLTKEKLEQELEAISTGEKREYILNGYKRINSLLDGTNASESAAHIILDQIAD